MHYRKLGRTNIDVSEIGYGAWGIGQKQWLGGTDFESLNALRRAIELGVDFIDTALAYGDGHSERLVGQVVAEHSHKIYVASKVPPKNRIWPARPGVSLDDVYPMDYVIDCTEASLKNLGVPYLDLQQFHVWNPEWTVRDEWKRAIEDLKTSGKVHYFGISINDHQPDSALDVIETGLIDTVQVIYNIFDQTPESKLFGAAIKHNIGVIARVPFDEGSLTGNINPDTVFPPGDFRESYFRGDRKQQVAEHVAALLADLELTRADLPQVAIRFCLSHPAVSTVIPGMRSLSSVEANCSYAGQGPLPQNTLAIIKHHAWDRNFYA
jgi:aryl-alcohol dehydrogenase-like predicted oxidoreductase